MFLSNRSNTMDRTLSALVEAMPFIHDIRFCQGGVREGFLFDSLTPEIKAQDPLEAATANYARDTCSSEKVRDLLYNAFPGSNDLDRSVPASCQAKHLLLALANTMYLQSSSSKESAAVAALHVPITGPLASAHLLAKIKVGPPIRYPSNPVFTIAEDIREDQKHLFLVSLG